MNAKEVLEITLYCTIQTIRETFWHFFTPPPTHSPD